MNTNKDDGNGNGLTETGIALGGTVAAVAASVCAPALIAAFTAGVVLFVLFAGESDDGDK
jgi:hypothetical protein